MLFDAVTHTYSDGGTIYLSVSKFLARFKPEFPKDLLAAKVATREGRSAADVLAEWELCGEIASGYGTAVHKAVEYWIRFGRMTTVPQLRKAVEAFAAKHALANLHAETIVKSDQHHLAGTTDVIEKLAPQLVNIIDIKTNGELTDEPKGKFLPPLDDLPFSKLNEYRLQLSTYKHLLERKGITVQNIELDHWNGEQFVTIPLVPINVEPLLLHL
jgi:hypothetical protein